MKRILLVAALFVSACASATDDVPGYISVVADSDSPYWRSEINKYVPRGVNDYAHFRIVNSPKAPYRLVVRVVNSDSQVSGFTTNRMFGTSVNYRNRVEVEAELLDPAKNSIWSWSGWGKSMKAVAKLIGKDMARAGLLDPMYYERETQ